MGGLFAETVVKEDDLSQVGREVVDEGVEGGIYFSACGNIVEVGGS